MTEVLPFECEHEMECSGNGVLIPDECPVYCGIYKRKRAREIEHIAVELRDKVLEHNTSESGRRCGGIDIYDLCDRMDKLGVSVDD